MEWPISSQKRLLKVSTRALFLFWFRKKNHLRDGIQTATMAWRLAINDKQLKTKI